MKRNPAFKILVCATLLVAVTGSLLAQERAPYVYIGIQKNSITSSDPESSWKDPIGGQVGVGIPLIFFGEALSIRAELNGSLQGAKWEDYGYKGRTDLWYINLPLTVRYKLKVGIFGEIGLQPGILLTAKDHYEGGGTESYTEYLHRFDLSIPIGIGYDINNNLGVGIRVIPGITNLEKDEGEKDHNFVVGLRVFYTFGEK